MSVENDKPSAAQLLRALSHPLRRRILRAMGVQTKSPSSIAEELGVGLPAVAYHFKVLRECNVLVLEETDAGGPSIEHFYHSVIGRNWAHSALKRSKREDDFKASN